MKKLGFNHMVVILVLVIASLVSPIQAAEKLEFSTLNAPILSLELGGIIIKEAYQRIGIEFTVKKLPPKRALFVSNKGETDGELLRVAGTEKNYPNLIMITAPVTSARFSVFTKNKQFTVDSPESIRPYKIGILRGMQASENLTKGMDVEMVNNMESLFGKLNLGRTDIVVHSHLDGLRAIKDLPAGSGVMVLTPPLKELPLFHYLHKKHADLVPKITASLEEMEKDGSIKKITEEFEAN